MANFFSADYWKALYFKAMGGQETAVDPNAMSGVFAGSSSWTGTLDLPEGAISGSFAGSSEFTGTLDGAAQYASQDFRNVLDGTTEDYWLRKRKREQEEKKRRKEEVLAALQIELKQAEADALALARGSDPSASKPVDAETKNPLDAVLNKLSRWFDRKREPQEAPELLKAQAEAEEAAALAEAVRNEEEEILILLLAA